MNAQTQRSKVLTPLSSGATLTPLDALSLYGIGRLAARVKELRDQSWDIVDDRRELKVRHSVYRLRTLAGQGLLMPLPEHGRPE